MKIFSHHHHRVRWEKSRERSRAVPDLKLPTVCLILETRHTNYDDDEDYDDAKDGDEDEDQDDNANDYDNQ